MPTIGNVRTRSNHHTVEEWESHRETIKRLYIDENKTQNEVRQIMEVECGFTITESQMKKQLDKWNLAANDVKLKRKEKAALLQLQEGRWVLENKTTEFRKEGKQVDPRTLSRFKQYLGKHGLPAVEFIDDSGVLSPPILQCDTKLLAASLAGVSYRTRSVNDNYPETPGIHTSGGWKKPRMGDITTKYVTGLRVRSEKTCAFTLEESSPHQFDSAASNTGLQFPSGGYLPQKFERSHNGDKPGPGSCISQPLSTSSGHSLTEILFQTYVNQDMFHDDLSQNSLLTEGVGGWANQTQLPQQSQSTDRYPLSLDVGLGTHGGDLLGSEFGCRLLLAVEKEDYPTLRGLLSQRVSVGYLPGYFIAKAFEWAVLKNQREMVQTLLDHGALPEAQVCHGIWASQWAVMADQEDIMNMLLCAKVDPNRASIREESLLHMAAERGTDGILRSLIQAGANVHARDENQRTPLHFAMRRGKNVVVVSELIGAGSEVNATDIYGNTPLHYATQLGDVEMVRTLLLSGADPNARNILQETPMFTVLDSARDGEAAPILLEHDAGVDFKSENGNISVHFATHAGRGDIVRVLLDCGADIAAQNACAQTPLYLAICRSHWEITNCWLKGVPSCLSGASLDTICRRLE